MRNDRVPPTHRPAYRRTSFGGATPIPIRPGIGKVLVMRKGPGFPGLGASPKKLDKLIRQSTPLFILP